MVKKVKLLLSGTIIGGIILTSVLVGGLWNAATPRKPIIQGQAEARLIEVGAKISGRIERLHVTEGDTVKAGTLLAEIDIPELRAKRAQILAQEEVDQANARLVLEGNRTEKIADAKAKFEKSLAAYELEKKTYSRIAKLFADGLVSAQKMDEVRAKLQTAQKETLALRSVYEMTINGSRTDEKVSASAKVKKTSAGLAEIESLVAEASLKAPVSGEISRIVLHPGEVAPAGFPVISILDHSDKWVTFNLRETELDGIRIGSELVADIPALKLSHTLLRVYYISPRADYATWRSTNQANGYDIRTFEVRCRTASPMPDLRPGMSVLISR